MVSRTSRIIVAAAALSWLCVASAPRESRAQAFIGAERCRECHEFEFRIWAAGPHAKAEKALTSEQIGDAKCNTCHAMAPGVKDSRLTGVQCERCHGAGQFYQHRYVMRDKDLSLAVGLIEPVAAHCQRCHTEGAPSIEPFDYERAWARIEHGRKARERWLRGRAQSGKGDGSAP